MNFVIISFNFCILYGFLWLYCVLERQLFGDYGTVYRFVLNIRQRGKMLIFHLVFAGQSIFAALILCVWKSHASLIIIQKRANLIWSARIVFDWYCFFKSVAIIISELPLANGFPSERFSLLGGTSTAYNIGVNRQLKPFIQSVY